MNEHSVDPPITPPPQATPTAPPLPNLLLGTSLLRNVDQTKLDNWEVKAKGGASIDGIHKEVNDMQESKKYDEVIVVCGSIDLESKDPAEIIVDYKALLFSVSSIANKITVSSILPRTDKNISIKTKTANVELKKMCDMEGHNFVDNDPSFHLMNGQVNSAFLTNDGLHLTKRGVDSLLATCGVKKEGSAFTPTKYPDPERSNKFLFRGHKNPLSNFFPVQIKTHGKQFKSSEAAYLGVWLGDCLP